MSPGEYTLKLNAATSGIVGRNWPYRALNSDSIVTWTIETTPPTIVSFAPVSSPRNADAGTVNISFSETVTGVNISDFSLTRDGAPVSLAALTVNGSGKDYTLDLSSVTGDDGAYVFTLTGASSGITDLAANGLLDNATSTWTTDSTLLCGTISPVASPRNTNVGTVDITFPVDVTGVDISDFQLKRDTEDIVLTAGMLTNTDAKTYHLDISSVAGVNGDYELALRKDGSGIQDGASNPLAADSLRNWVMDATPPAPPLINETAIGANLGGSGNVADHINAALKGSFNSFKVSISNTGVGNEAGTLYIKLTDGAAHTLTTSGEAIAAGAGIANRGTFLAGAINTWSDGNISLEAWIVDAAGNESAHASVTKTYCLDSQAPSVALSDNHADAIVRDADTVIITATFTEADQVDESAPPAMTIGTLVVGAAMTKTDNLHWTYTWDVPAGAGNDGAHAVSITARDRSGNSNSAATGKTSYTVDNTLPTVSVVNPVDGAVAVPAGANLVLTMSENVVAGTGVIEIWRTSVFGSPVIFESFTLPSGRVTIVGNTVTIDPTNNLANNRYYAVLIDGNCLRDAAGNYFTGYLTTTEWDFDTY